MLAIECFFFLSLTASDQTTNVLLTDVFPGHHNTFGFLTISTPLEEDAFVAVLFRLRFRKTIRMQADVVL